MVPLSCAGRDALLFRRDDVERHDRQHRAVHRHRHGHLIERDLVEEDLHVLDRVDRHAGLADIAAHTLVVGVVAAMRREIERHRQALLPGGEIAPVEGVRLLRRREPGVLPDRPRLQRVHRRVRSAQERRHPRRVVEMLHAVEIVRGVVRLHADVLRRSATHRLRPARPGAWPGRGAYGMDAKSGRFIWTPATLRPPPPLDAQPCPATASASPPHRLPAWTNPATPAASRRRHSAPSDSRRRRPVPAPSGRPPPRTRGTPRSELQSTTRSGVTARRACRTRSRRSRRTRRS